MRGRGPGVRGVGYRSTGARVPGVWKTRGVRSHNRGGGIHPRLWLLRVLNTRLRVWKTRSACGKRGVVDNRGSGGKHKVLSGKHGVWKIQGVWKKTKTKTMFVEKIYLPYNGLL